MSVCVESNDRIKTTPDAHNVGVVVPISMPFGVAVRDSFHATEEDDARRLMASLMSVYPSVVTATQRLLALASLVSGGVLSPEDATARIGNDAELVKAWSFAHALTLRRIRSAVARRRACAWDCCHRSPLVVRRSPLERGRLSPKERKVIKVVSVRPTYADVSTGGVLRRLVRSRSLSPDRYHALKRRSGRGVELPHDVRALASASLSTHKSNRSRSSLSSFRRRSDRRQKAHVKVNGNAYSVPIKKQKQTDRRQWSVLRRVLPPDVLAVVGSLSASRHDERAERELPLVIRAQQPVIFPTLSGVGDVAAE